MTRSSHSRDEGGKGQSVGVKHVQKKSKKLFKKQPPRRSKSATSSRILTGGMTFDGGQGKSVEHKESTAPRKHIKMLLQVSKTDVRSKKERRSHRKQQRTDFELVKETKVIWEHLRQRKRPPERGLALEEMMAMAQGHFKEMSVKHDTARVVQSCLKYGSTQHRTQVFSELQGHIVELSKQKYSKFVLKALLKYCSAEEREQIICSLYGHVCKLLRHSEASDLVETVYNVYANASQRTALIQEFYATEFSLFKDGLTGDQRVQPSGGLGEWLETRPTYRKRVLTHMKDVLVPLINKEVVRHSIIHRALLDYLLNCTPEARAEMVENLREKVASILHTDNGARVACQCVWHGSTKDRKIIVKSFKTLVSKICQEENGHIVILALFDCVDDTVLIKKAILSEVREHLSELCENQFGRRVVLYLLSPRSPRHFHPQFVALLSPGDANTVSKKPAATRRRELLEAMGPSFLALATSKALDWMQNTSRAPLLLEVAISLPGDLTALYQVIVELVCSDDGGRLMEQACAHWFLKRLIATDTHRTQGGQPGFVDKLLSSVSSEQLCVWATLSNRSAFVVSALLQAAGPNRVLSLEKVLKPLQDTLAESSLKGQQAIANQLSKLKTSNSN